MAWSRSGHSLMAAYAKGLLCRWDMRKTKPVRVMGPCSGIGAESRGRAVTPTCVCTAKFAVIAREHSLPANTDSLHTPATWTVATTLEGCESMQGHIQQIQREVTGLSIPDRNPLALITCTQGPPVLLQGDQMLELPAEKGARTLAAIDRRGTFIVLGAAKGGLFLLDAATLQVLDALPVRTC